MHLRKHGNSRYILRVDGPVVTFRPIDQLLLSEIFSAPIDQPHLYFLLWDTAHDFECLCQPDISVLLVLIKCHSANMRSDRSQFTSTLCPFTHNTYYIDQDRDSYQCSERGRLLSSELPEQPPDDETTQNGDNRAER